MRLEVHVNMDGAAFQDSTAPPFEVARILRAAADEIDACGTAVDETVRLRDRNGNRVGFLVVTEDAGTRVGPPPAWATEWNSPEDAVYDNE